jgi:RNase P subunit RPR2
LTSRKARNYARKKVTELLSLAEILAKNDPETAKEVAELAFITSRKLRVRIPRKVKRRFCRRCHVPLIPGVTMRIRIKRKTLVVTCLTCGWIRRYELSRRVDKGEN